jgi:septal ring factor EnvC (AmiA/AmiB activator)
LTPVIQGVLSEDLDQRMTGLTAQIEAIRDNVASLDIKLTEMAETNQDTNDRIKNIEDLILAIVQAKPNRRPK